MLHLKDIWKTIEERIVVVNIVGILLECTSTSESDINRYVIAGKLIDSMFKLSRAKLAWTMFNNSDRTAKKAARILIAKITWLTLFKEIFCLRWESYQTRKQKCWHVGC
jgi:hypothetical protein